MEAAIIIAAFAGGFISMFAVHMLIVDIYDQRHRQQVRKLEDKIRRLQKGDGKDKNFKGAVTVSYNINYVSGNKKVARTARTSLYKPSYLGKEGGYVVVEVRVNRNGTVTSAVVIESSNSALNDVARKAALNNTGTLFNIDTNAPSSNVGTITYTFVAQ